MPDLKPRTPTLISIVIICFNEEANIIPCIKSCLPISNDIIVVDSHSTDNTRTLAESVEAKVHLKTWEGYGQAKNYGAKLCKNEWIFSIDADERLSIETVDFLLNNKLNSSEIYGVNRVNFIGSKKIRFGEWYPDYNPRLYNKLVAKWSESAVHEQLLFDNNLETTKVPGKLLHYSFVDGVDLEKRLEQYARLAASELHANDVRVNAVHLYLKPAFRFIRSYLFKLGFLDGSAGWTIAKANAKAVKKRYLFLAEMNRSSKTS